MIAHSMNALIFIGAIAISLFAGKLIAHYCGGLPGSLYGMLIFCGLLQLGIIQAKRVQTFALQFIQYMPIVFLPVCVGVIEYSDMIQTFGIKLVITGLLTTFSTMTLVAVIANTYLKNSTINNPVSSRGNDE